MSAHSLAQLPIPAAGCGDCRVTSDGVRLVLEYEYRAERVDWIGSIVFSDVIAYQFRDETHSQGYCSESYHAVAEIRDSAWLAGLVRLEPRSVNDCAGKRHLAVFLGAYGYLEVIAEAFVLGEPRLGRLS